MNPHEPGWYFILVETRDTLYLWQGGWGHFIWFCVDQGDISYLWGPGILESFGDPGVLGAAVIVSAPIDYHVKILIVSCHFEHLRLISRN